MKIEWNLNENSTSIPNLQIIAIRITEQDDTDLKM